MQVSLVTTICNEETSIRGFMEAILNQSRLPDEMIIVDGGSTDQTIFILENEYLSRYPFIRLFKEKCNIARGRNLAIQKSNYNLVAVTDAGCFAAQDWLKKLAAPFEADATLDVSGGVTLPLQDNLFQKVAVAYFMVSSEQMQQNPRLISSRNIAFKKTIWEKAGGYPEWLELTGEDTLFNQQLINAGAVFKVIPEAKVHWKATENLAALHRKAFSYSRGNGEAGLYQKTIMKTMLVYAVVLVLFILGIVHIYFAFAGIVLWFLYLLYSAVKLAVKLKSAPVIGMGMIVKSIIDVSNLMGYLMGLMLRLRHQNTNPRDN